MKWKPISTAPEDTEIYVWLPKWNGRGPLVRTKWTGFWWNDLLNGSAPPNFNPEWWDYIPDGPVDSKEV